MNNNAQLEELIQQIGQNCNISFEKLYRSCDKAVFSYILSITKSFVLSEDIMQETFLTIRAAASTYRCMGKPMAWILRIAKNSALMYIRKHRHEIMVDYSEEEYLFGGYENNLDDIIVLKASLKYLNDKQREILFLHVVVGFKHREIAKQLEIPLGTVLWNYHRAIKILSDRMKNEQEGSHYEPKTNTYTT
jgi:RNA polymerase sigma factor (sigma-70 family)